MRMERRPSFYPRTRSLFSHPFIHYAHPLILTSIHQSNILTSTSSHLHIHTSISIQYSLTHTSTHSSIYIHTFTHPHIRSSPRPHTTRVRRAVQPRGVRAPAPPRGRCGGQSHDDTHDGEGGEWERQHRYQAVWRTYRQSSEKNKSAMKLLFSP